MIKSTTTSIKFANKEKQASLVNFIDEYKNVISNFIDLIWDMDKIPILLPKEITSKVETWLSARMLQAAAKQASGIVRGTRKKQEKRLFMINRLIKENKLKRARKLQKIYDEIKISKPKIDQVNPELDSRFIKIDLDNKTSFDGWITIGSIGNKIKLILPFKKHEHFNKLLNKGKLKSGIRISKKSITFMFDIEKPKIREVGEILGIDIGQNNVVSCSDGFSSQKNNHGYDLNNITDILCRKIKGSKNFNKTIEHRKNYINWSINQLNLDNVKEVRIENIKNLRKGKRTNRKLSHWNYSDIFSKLESYFIDHGVHVNKINPTYTSKRCSACGWTRSRNRKGKLFICGQCGNTIDSDINAARNISMNLAPIFYGSKIRQKLNVKQGFYWRANGEEPVVPPVQKA
jgi:IS605 OrfB family transposase